jgi:hypothetical protein
VLASVGTDVVHAASMVAAVAVWPEYRRAELASAAIATASAVLTAGLAAPRRTARSLWS